MLLKVNILSNKAVILQKEAKSLVLPGEQGVFEVLPFHKRLLSRLISGTVVVDNKSIPIKRGIVRIEQNCVTAIVEEE